MAVAATTIDHEILDMMRQRLHELELQAAQRGSATPPEIRIEIREIKRQLAEAEAPGSPAEQYLDLRATAIRHGHYLAAIAAGQIITLLLVLLLLARAVQPSVAQQQPYAAPASAGIAAPATSPVAGGSAPSFGGRP